MENKIFLYKYQPSNLDDFYFEQDLKSLIELLIFKDNVNCLFYGTTGCGKTSLIYTLLQKYYESMKYKENIMVINNLMEQGISYYRHDVKIFCQTRSTIKNKKKIVVLDDIDLISEQSQQAFRNCIDKYSSNVNFIASCTYNNKVIESLQSRLFIIKLPSITNTELNKITNKICSNENICITEEAKKITIQISNYSVRCLINYLEKYKLLNKNIDKDIVANLCTNIVFDDLKKYTNLCIHNNLSDAITLLYKIHDDGYSVMDIFDNYFIFIKICDIFTDTKKYEIISLICKYIVHFNNIHEDEIELAIFTNNLIKLIR
tara:strand:- start:10438 stop:11391 length:954 start_codon:yes stop_codon:yes gene_type:complete